MTLLFSDRPVFKDHYVGVISCSSRKRFTRNKAKDMYTGAHFKFCRRYVEKNFTKWYILSAYYGICDPDLRIRPYDNKLSEYNKEELTTYKTMVDKQWDEWIGDKPVMCLLWAQYYRIVQRPTTLNLFGVNQRYPYCGEVFQKSLMVKWPVLTPKALEEIKLINKEKE